MVFQELSRLITCQIEQVEHMNMTVKLVVLMMILSWMRDLPITLYPGAPPLIQIRGKPATDQPLNRGILQHNLLQVDLADVHEVRFRRVVPGNRNTESWVLVYSVAE